MKNNPPSQPSESRPGSKWLIVFLIWIMMVVAYMDRVNISLAGPDIMADLKIGKAAFGTILAAFSLGYAALQVPGGWLSDRYGSKPLLVLGLIVWSLFTGLTGLCASFVTLAFVRFLFGGGEGLENGAQFKLIGDHFDEKTRSFANGVFLSSLALGPALASPATAQLLKILGWRTMFFAFAALGVVVALVLAFFLPKAPPPEEGNRVQVDFGRMLKRLEVWRLILAYFLFNIAFWGFIGWTPTYLKEQRHYSLTDHGFVGSIPYLFGFVGLLILGRVASGPLLQRRSLLVGVCYIAAAVALFAGLSLPSIDTTIVGLTIAAFFLYSAFAPFWAIAIGYAGPEERGALTGVVNFGGQLGGFAGQLVVGLIAGRMHSFNGAITFMSASLLAGGLLMFWVKSNSSTYSE